MTAAGAAETFAAERHDGIRNLGVYGTALGVAIGASGLAGLVSAVFAAGDDTIDALVLAGVGTGGVGFAALLARRPFEARAMRAVPTLTACVLAYLAVAAISTVVYLATGSLSRVDDALYESVTGVATSSLTLFEDPQVLGRGVLVWRAATQWIGGLLALGVAIGIYPFLGGSRELADPRARGFRRLALANKPIPALKRVVTMYGVVTVVVAVALLIVGLSVTDAVAHTFSSVSTGGFSTHADSIAHFDSRAVDVVMIVVMAGAGFSLALVWMLATGQFQDTLRVYELRVYALVLALASVWVWWLADPLDDATGVVDHGIDSVFTVVSLSTTTGHRVADWGSWHPGAEMMLLTLLAIGGMAGSVAGGLRWIRVVGLVQFVWRELQRQLHPRTVRAVKVGSSAISEESIDRWHAHLLFTMFLTGTGAVALAFFGSDILEALTLALSAVSTTGPALAEDGGTLQSAATLSRSDRAALMPLMLAGRLAITPMLVGVGVVVFGAQRRLSAQAFRRRLQGRT
ncbi:MAG: potassium transporter TrkG [Actinomycetota bacterium]